MLHVPQSTLLGSCRRGIAWNIWFLIWAQGLRLHGSKNKICSHCGEGDEDGHNFDHMITNISMCSLPHREYVCCRKICVPVFRLCLGYQNSIRKSCFCFVSFSSKLIVERYEKAGEKRKLLGDWSVNFKVLFCRARGILSVRASDHKKVFHIRKVTYSTAYAN